MGAAKDAPNDNRRGSAVTHQLVSKEELARVAKANLKVQAKKDEARSHITRLARRDSAVARDAAQWLSERRLVDLCCILHRSPAPYF